MQNISQRLNPQKTPHTSPWRASYGMSFMNILEKIDRVITALHCSLFLSSWLQGNSMPSHQQNTQDFADGRKNMNGIFDNYFCSASHMHPGGYFQNV